jgi:hypothetical protein
VVIVSLVREGGARGTAGFLDDPRRLNVSLSRAQNGLIIVGSAGLGAAVPSIGKLYAYLAKRNAITKAAVLLEALSASGLAVQETRRHESDRPRGMAEFDRDLHGNLAAFAAQEVPTTVPALYSHGETAVHNPFELLSLAPAEDEAPEAAAAAPPAAAVAAAVVPSTKAKPTKPLKKARHPASAKKALIPVVDWEADPSQAPPAAAAARVEKAVPFRPGWQIFPMLKLLAQGVHASPLPRAGAGARRDVLANAFELFDRRNLERFRPAVYSRVCTVVGCGFASQPPFMMCHDHFEWLDVFDGGVLGLLSCTVEQAEIMLMQRLVLLLGDFEWPHTLLSACRSWELGRLIDFLMVRVNCPLTGYVLRVLQIVVYPDTLM